MFLPINREDMQLRDWHYLDFLIISGDAIVDHASFGPPLIGRWLEHLGYRVGILAQPDWRDIDAFKVMGKPRYAVLISAGNMDSMVNHYTATKKPRRQDAYSPGGVMGRRPDYATIVYSKMAKKAFPGTPLILGGVEASLRRFAHYDFWQDNVLPSILVDSQADLLVYGMGELPLQEITAKLAAGGSIADCRRIAGVCYLTKKPPQKKVVEIPSLRQVKQSKRAFAQAFAWAEQEQNFYDGKPVIQRQQDCYLVANPPSRPLTTKEMDQIYELPFENRWHPSYDALGGVPAFAEVEFSILSHRGCFGGCSFCSINFHQGAVIQNRSDESILREAKKLTEKPNFKGYIHDVGGPTANFRNQGCEKAKKRGVCKNRLCLYPEPCKNLKPNQAAYLKLLQKIQQLPKVKKVFIRSGIRYDYIMADRRDDFLEQLCRHHISGLLKVAPEHSVPHVLAAMAKPPFSVYQKFQERFYRLNKKIGKKQYILPYFIAAHPGSKLTDAIDLAVTMKHSGLQPEQVQLFLPTPGSRSTCMYYSGINPMTMQSVYVSRKPEERAMQRALLQFADQKNWPLVRKALRLAGREDLIGQGTHCLVPPERANDRKKQEVWSQARQKNRGRTNFSNEQKTKSGRKRPKQTSHR